MASITQLRYIIAVDKFRHFGKAARYCHVAQPSLSIQIQKVEEEHDFVIFDRMKKPIMVTERGQEFIEQAKEVIKAHDKLSAIAGSEPGVPRGEFTLAIIPTILPYLLPLFLKPFGERFPKVTLIVEEMQTDAIIEALREDTIDAAILATPLEEEGIREYPLFYEPFSIYLHKNHPLCHKNLLRVQDLSEDEIWLLKDGHCMRQQISHFCHTGASRGMIPSVHFEGSSIEALRQVIKTTGGYTLVPELFVRQLESKELDQSVRTLKAPAPSREVSLIATRALWKKDILTALRETIEQCVPPELPRKVSRSIGVIPIKGSEDA